MLRDHGHHVSVLTLTGLGERAHLLDDDVGLSTHIDDVVGHIEIDDLTDIDLVGWSYGGMVVTGVLARVPDRIRSVCYLDAFLPSDGQALADCSRGAMRDLAHEHSRSRTPFPIRQPEQFGVTDLDTLAYCRPRLRPQPWKTMVEPVTALSVVPQHVSLTYVLCTRPVTASFQAAYDTVASEPRWTLRTLAADHFAPLSNPVGTVEAIVGEA
jgi:pimeloyl-ACP methyl ester carboxylesterase